MCFKSAGLSQHVPVVVIVVVVVEVEVEVLVVEVFVEVPVEFVVEVVVGAGGHSTVSPAEVEIPVITFSTCVPSMLER